MNRVQKKALKLRVRSGLKARKVELKKLIGASSRFHFKSDRAYKVACSSLKKEIRFYSRLWKRI